MRDEESARSWVERVQRGDRKAFARLVGAHGPDLDLVHDRLRGPARADFDRADIASETVTRDQSFPLGRRVRAGAAFLAARYTQEGATDSVNKRRVEL